MALPVSSATQVVASPLTTKGDIFTYSTTGARLAVGTNGKVLTADSTAATGLSWQTPASGGGSGDVVGPSSSTDNALVRFDLATGKLVQNSTVILDDTGAMSGVSIATLPNLTSNGFVKTSGGAGTLSIDTTTYLTANQSITFSGDVSGTGTTTVVLTIGAGKVTEAMQVLADNITNDVSTTKHGYAPKGDGDTTKFLNANGAYSVPAGGGGSTYYTYSESTGTTQSLAVNTTYSFNNAALCTATLPATAAVGDKIMLVGKGAGFYSIAQNASQTIHFGNLSSTVGVGGSVAATHRYDVIEIMCITANTTWICIRSMGNFTIV